MSKAIWSVEYSFRPARLSAHADAGLAALSSEPAAFTRVRVFIDWLVHAFDASQADALGS
jgi:hypothetical protein